jgi:protein tyrosine/serine phosphatase
MKVNPSQSLTKTGRKLLLAATPALIIGLVVWGWFGFAKDRVIPKKFGVVVPEHIYRSGQISSSLIRKILEKYNIRVIIDLTPFDSKNRDKLAEKKAADELKVKILRFPMNGNGTGDINDYASAVISIVDAEKNDLPVLVHCVAGSARTGGVIATYRLLVQKTPPNIVEDELEKYGCHIDEKPVMRAFLNDNMAELAVLLRKAGVIDEIPSPLPQLPHD